MKLDTAKLKQLAEQATLDGEELIVSNAFGGDWFVVTENPRRPVARVFRNYDYAKFIVAASPDVVLSLLARLDRLEAGLERACCMLDKTPLEFYEDERLSLIQRRARRAERAEELADIRKLLSGEDGK